VKRIFRRLLFALLFSTLLFEGLAFLADRLGFVRLGRPSYKLEYAFSEFWAELNDDFGVWHHPNARYRQTTACYDVTYESNSYGARDVEREKTSHHKRVLVLGDSFMEGYGVSTQKRMTGLLEQSTGKEHLNFGCAGNTGPTHYFLVYQHLAKQFSHEAVLVGVLPANDFLDDDISIAPTLYPNRYRPYFVGEYPNYKLVYYETSREKALSSANTKDRAKHFFAQLRNALNEFSYGFRLIRMAEFYRVRMQLEKEKSIAPEGFFAGYYDFKPDQWKRMRFCLEKIQTEAVGKKMAVILIPTKEDFYWYSKKLEPAPLSRYMERLAGEKGFLLVDLLEPMYKFQKDYNGYFFDCNDHWNEHGNQVAADLVRERLQTLYRE
jgi:hypothetical protein